MFTSTFRTQYLYRIDSEDRIVWVNADWVAFAEENHAPELTREAVKGRSLFDFISGAETRQLYRVVMERVRASGQTAVLPFRCDGPAVKRLMELAIRLGPNGGIEFASHMIRTEQRRRVPLLDASFRRSREWLHLCSWCKRVQVESGEWVEPEEAVRRLGLFLQPELPRTSHGICLECKDMLEREYQAV